MTIKYADGRSSEAVLLSRTNNTMRVVLKDSDDATDLTQVNGSWIAQDSMPVRVEFAWQLRARAVTPALSDCICSKELAAKLVDLLYAHSRVVEPGGARKHLTAGS